MNPGSVATVLVVIVACLAIPVAAVLVIGEAVMRAGERKGRARLHGPTRYQAAAEKHQDERRRA